MDWLRKHRPSRFPLQRLSSISGSNDIACISKIYTISILLIIIEISKVNMCFFFLQYIYLHSHASETPLEPSLLFYKRTGMYFNSIQLSLFFQTKC
jgi:hypothetical protein